MLEVEFIGELDDSLEGYYSFTFYWNNKKTRFQDTDYYWGLDAYRKMIQENAFFEKVGMIIYTDAGTLALLEEFFGGQSKVVLALTKWPDYEIAEGKVEPSILRCMRYHAVAAFPGKWIAIRDADTLFPGQLSAEGDTGFIEAWEEGFTRGWPAGKIVIGVHRSYQQTWHANMPFPNTLKKNKNSKNSTFYRQMSYKNRMRTLLNKNNIPIFEAPLGMYAGFVNFPVGYESVWPMFEKYLYQRFFITEAGEISNKDSIIPSIGKDERLLLFSLLPEYFDRIYFFTIDYNNTGTFNVDSHDSSYPAEVFKTRDGKRTDEYFRGKFAPFVEEYKRWMSIRTPTEREKTYKNFIRGSNLFKKNENLFYKGGRRTRRLVRKRKL